MKYEDIIQFWFNDIDSSFWWKKDDDFDQQIRQKFMETHQKASLGELFDWRKTPMGRLAEIIVLDQFSRNMFRDTPRAFAYDPLALVLAQEAVAAGADQQIDLKIRSFVYMPYMHSESLKIHDQAIKLFSQEGMEGSLDFENRHRDIIVKYGRYPHRNKILGRESSKEEIEFLTQPGSSF